MHTTALLTRSVFLFSMLVLSFALVGCGAPTRGKQAYQFQPVKGRVLFNDQPITQGTINFTNPDDSNFVASSPISSDGTFSLTTTTIFSSSKNPGAPMGKYKVMINPPSDGKRAPQPLMADGIFEVKSGPNEFKIELR